MQSQAILAISVKDGSPVEIILHPDDTAVIPGWDADYYFAHRLDVLTWLTAHTYGVTIPGYGIGLRIYYNIERARLRGAGPDHRTFQAMNVDPSAAILLPWLFIPLNSVKKMQEWAKGDGAYTPDPERQESLNINREATQEGS